MTACARRLQRALSQRILLLSLETAGDGLVLHVLGASGQKYWVTFPARRGLEPRCTCPDHSIRRVKCKHILWASLKVLPAGEAPRPGPAPAPRLERRNSECCVCLVDFEEGESAEVCARCRNGIHGVCLSRWSAAKADRATCPTCRGRDSFAL